MKVEKEHSRLLGERELGGLSYTGEWWARQREWGPRSVRHAKGMLCVQVKESGVYVQWGNY